MEPIVQGGDGDDPGPVHAGQQEGKAQHSRDQHQPGQGQIGEFPP